LNRLEVVKQNYVSKPHPLVDCVNPHLRKESPKSKKGQITAIEERSARPTEGAGNEPEMRYVRIFSLNLPAF
jgi:hypothetical protein